MMNDIIEDENLEYFLEKINRKRYEDYKKMYLEDKVWQRLSEKYSDLIENFWIDLTEESDLVYSIIQRV